MLLSSHDHVSKEPSITLTTVTIGIINIHVRLYVLIVVRIAGNSKFVLILQGLGIFCLRMYLLVAWEEGIFKPVSIFPS